MRRKSGIVLLLLLGIAMTNFPARANEPLAPDIIVVRGNIHTMNSQQPLAQALAILGNRIVAVGSDEEISRIAGPKTKVIDARGRLDLPGFNDAHVHFLSGGFQLSSVDLRDANTTEEFADLVILSHDIFQIAPEEIEHARIILTMIDGREVYRAH